MKLVSEWGKWNGKCNWEMEWQMKLENERKSFKKLTEQTHKKQICKNTRR